MNIAQDQATTVNLEAIKKALKRRWLPACVGFFLLLSVFVALAALLPPVYRSSATILIEQQEIPQDMVRSTVTSLADQRIQMILQRVMTFSKLSEIIKKYNLYPEKRQTKPLEEIVDKMREDINHDMISADVVDPQSGRPVQATIAFSIAYLSERPDTAQKVANELVSTLLEENLKNRSAMAQEAEQFLASELARLKDKMARLEDQLASFKEKNLRSLPDQASLNINFVERAHQELADVRNKIQNQEERKAYLQAKLIQVDPYKQVSGTGSDAALTTEGRIRLLQSRYLSLTATYSPDHPDVVKTKRELDELVGNSNLTLNRSIIERQLKILRAEFDKMRAMYSADHPDIKKLQRQIDDFESKLKAAPGSSRPGDAADADNPVYIQISTDLKSAGIDLQHLYARRDELSARIDKYESALGAAPLVEKQYRDILRDYDNTTHKYQEIKNKQLEAQLAWALEKEGKGERLTLIDAPLLPEKPIRPNRLIIVVLGAFASVVFAVGLVWALEAMDRTVKTEADLLRATGMAPLVMIPHIATDDDKRQERRKMRWLAAGAGSFGVLMLLAVHFLFMPLDVLWFVAMRKLG